MEQCTMAEMIHQLLEDLEVERSQKKEALRCRQLLEQKLREAGIPIPPMAGPNVGEKKRSDPDPKSNSELSISYPYPAGDIRELRRLFGGQYVFRSKTQIYASDRSIKNLEAKIQAPESTKMRELLQSEFTFIEFIPMGDIIVGIQ
jgi:hypothetical protein